MPDPAGPDPAGRAPGPGTPTPDETSAKLVMAFDFGQRRIGMACGDTVSRTASPLRGVDNGGTGPRWDAIEARIREWRPDLLVVGLPYNVDGSDSRVGRAARRFAAQLAERYALPVSLIDERYSSLEAADRLRSERDAGLRKRRVAKADVDAAAACVILERWFVESTKGADAFATR
jgi:putative Holliday junction resolvase